MYIPKSFLSRLLGAAWTILFVSVLLWLAARLLADAWIWIAIIVVVLILIRLAIWWRRVRREWW
jgi:small-conductance mechanosensitive channel